MLDESTLILGLIAANWSAFNVALKCREKIDSCRDTLLGVTGNRPEDRDARKYLFDNDVIGFALALVATFMGVGTLILAVGIYIWKNQNLCVIEELFALNGSLMCAIGALFSINGSLMLLAGASLIPSIYHRKLRRLVDLG